MDLLCVTSEHGKYKSFWFHRGLCDTLFLGWEKLLLSTLGIALMLPGNQASKMQYWPSVLTFDRLADCSCFPKLPALMLSKPAAGQLTDMRLKSNITSKQMLGFSPKMSNYSVRAHVICVRILEKSQKNGKFWNTTNQSLTQKSTSL